MLFVVLGTVVLNVYLFMIVPKGFFPQQDTGRLGGSTRGAQDISFEAMNQKQNELAQMVLDDPAILSVTAFVGGNGPGGGGSNVGRMFISLKPVNERKDANGHIVTGDMVVNRLRSKLTSVPGATLFLQVQQELQIGGRGSDAQYQYTLSDENLDELNTWAPQLLARMRTMPELRDVSTDQQNQGLAANLVIDRDTASRLGVTATAIDNVLYDAFGQREVSTMYTGLNQYFVVMEVDPQYQLSPDALNNIYVKASTTQGATTAMPATTTPTSAAGSAASPATTPLATAATTALGGATAVFPASAGNLAVTATGTIAPTGNASSVNPVVAGTLTGLNPPWELPLLLRLRALRRQAAPRPRAQPHRH